jgi:hypothetical protein
MDPAKNNFNGKLNGFSELNVLPNVLTNVLAV